MSKKELTTEALKYLGNYDERVFDGDCGEVIGWGYVPNGHLGEITFDWLREYGEWVCLYPNWYLITRWLTPQEAIEKYGKITKIREGIRGGYKSTTYGEKQFCSSHLNPHGVIEIPADVEIVVVDGSGQPIKR